MGQTCKSSNLAPIPPSVLVELNYLKGIVACFKKQIDTLTTIINNSNIDKPPIFIPWAEITNNKYLNNALKDTTFEVMLNGIRFLIRGVEFVDLDTGGFEIIDPNLLNAANDYVVIR